MDALTQARLAVLGVILAIGAFWALSTVRDRRRQAHFAALAQSLGSKAMREGEHLSRFPVEIDGRAFDVRLQHLGGGLGSSSGPGWCVITKVALQGVLDVHSTEIRPRARRPRGIDLRNSDFEKHFTVHDAGYPLRQGWLNEHVRGAIAHFYALELPLDPLSIEEGHLVHRALLPVQRFSGDTLRELLTRQVAVARALEHAL